MRGTVDVKLSSYGFGIRRKMADSRGGWCRGHLRTATYALVRHEVNGPNFLLFTVTGTLIIVDAPYLRKREKTILLTIPVPWISILLFSPIYS